MDNLFCSGRGEGKKACPVLKNSLSGGEKGLSGVSWGSFKTKFATLNNGTIRKNQGKNEQNFNEKISESQRIFFLNTGGNSEILINPVATPALIQPFL